MELKQKCSLSESASKSLLATVEGKHFHNATLEHSVSDNRIPLRPKN